MVRVPNFAGGPQANCAAQRSRLVWTSPPAVERAMTTGSVAPAGGGTCSSARRIELLGATCFQSGGMVKVKLPALSVPGAAGAPAAGGVAGGALGVAWGGTV